jgi:hypothetical protein
LFHFYLAENNELQLVSSSALLSLSKHIGSLCICKQLLLPLIVRIDGLLSARTTPPIGDHFILFDISLVPQLQIEHGEKEEYGTANFFHTIFFFKNTFTPFQKKF